MTDKTALGDRMKLYEGMEAQRRAMPRRPILARIDRKCLSTYTKGLKKPFDSALMEAMILTTEELVRETHALLGYTQSDEISLVFYAEKPNSQVFCDGRIQKLTSVLASMATAYFNTAKAALLPKLNSAFFDCRVWTVPDLNEAANVFLWRQRDAVRNSIAMVAQAHFSHRQLHKKSRNDMLKMLKEKGIDWRGFPDVTRLGTFVKKDVIKIPLTEEELAVLPLKHTHRQNPDQLVTRTKMVRFHGDKCGEPFNHEILRLRIHD